MITQRTTTTSTTKKTTISPTINPPIGDSNDHINEVVPANEISGSSTQATNESEEYEYYYDDEEEEVINCEGKEYVPSSDCTQYYHCVHDKPVMFHCKDKTVFETNLQICVWPEQADREECKGKHKNAKIKHSVKH